MNDYSLGRLYDILKGDLMEWIGRNPKTKFNITPHNLTYLFEFHKRNGLSIDLSRFDKAYYLATFHPPESKQEVKTAFVRKVIAIIRNRLQEIAKEEIDLTITVRHRVSQVNYWQTCYIGQKYDPKEMAMLTRKENDWL
ncbi:hypothetical protein [Mucilaginibacter flavus]|uniref:hypothetical protein n=1 Tax=Mucilaginibacter flavus TaxID=931504 RepID=UPI0025B5A562|nr:hypothetical protein [Mucilaginibacter flavus]MDN3583842.1 hypothetical protein [Mucilaginibacter flavus]